MGKLLRSRAVWAGSAAFTVLVVEASIASAAVTQPDGVVMPLPGPSNEVSLQQLFDFKEGAGALDAKMDAATEPATFKPLCDFTAQLLLHETGNKTAFVGWYNSPSGDTPPKTVCDQQTGMSSGGGPCTKNDIFPLIKGDVANPPYGKAADPLHHPGQVFTGGDIAASPYYAGGEIGFVLMAAEGHFSEKRLNPACTGTGCIAGDHWIPTIMYASKKTPQGYYMCSEDQNVGPSTWGGNDGDFNDYVFLLTGLVCSGSGQACDTGQPGVCAAGLTDCQNELGQSDCRPARKPSDEQCNGLDDDCNGDTDEGDICPAGQRCVKARCVPDCGTGEFRCDVNHQCVEGACVELACVDKTCPAGKVCMGGKCIGACDGVTCPNGQNCADGVCVDPCDGIDCGKGFVCEAGACVVACTCGGCTTGECNAKTGHCVDDGCSAVTCGAGQHCSAGACVDDCDDAKCPGDADCHEGKCDPPASGNQDVIGATGGAPDGPGIDLGGTGVNVDPTPTAGSFASGGTPGTSGTGSDTTNGNPGPAALKDPGCACRQGPAARNTRFGVLGLVALGLIAALRRRRSKS